MALLFADPCGKFYATTAQALQGVWNTLTAIAIKTSALPTGFVEDTCFNLGGANAVATVALPSATAGPYIYSVRLYFDVLPAPGTIFTVQNSSVQGQVNYKSTGAGTIQALRGATLLGTSSSAALLTAGTWNRIDFKTSISAASGIVGIRINGIDVLSLTGQNTNNAGTADAQFFQLFGGFAGVTEYAQSVYILDTTGSFNKAYIPDQKMTVLNAAGAGTAGLNQYTPNGAATVWQSVSDVTPDDAATFASDATPGDRMSVTYAASAAVGAIAGVVHVSRVSKSDAGARTYAQAVRSNLTDAVDATTAPATTFGYKMQILETDPNTGAAWTNVGLNAAEGGIETIA